MRQTLFYIPQEIAGVPLFGFGIVLAVWAVIGLLLIVQSIRRSGWGGETRSQIAMLVVSGFVIAYIIPAIMEPDGLPIRGYGVMMLLAVGSGVGLALHRAKQFGIDPEIIISLAMWLIPSGFIGARAFYVIEYWDKFAKPDPGEFIAGVLNITQGGLVVYGSLLAGGAAMVVFIYKYKLPGLALADLVAPCAVLGMAIGRVGCFLNGCCYGGACDLPWKVEFPDSSPAYYDQVQSGKLFLHGLRFQGEPEDAPVIAEVEPGSQAANYSLRAGQRIAAIGGVPVESIGHAQQLLLRLTGEGTKVSIEVAADPQPKTWTIVGPPPVSLPIHPVQIYSVIDALLLVLLLLAYTPFRQRDGEVTALLLTLHPISRFLLEIIRVDEHDVFNTSMSISQNISLGLLLGAVVLWLYLMRRPRGLAWPAGAVQAA